MASTSIRQRSASPSTSSANPRRPRRSASPCASPQSLQSQTDLAPQPRFLAPFEGELSFMSTDTESSATFPDLLSRTRKRITNYVPDPQQKNGHLLQDSLNACLDWLPDKGRVSLARDIVGAQSPAELYAIFQNILTCLAGPMKARSKPPSPSPSSHQKRRDHVKTLSGRIPNTPETRKERFRNDCLKRDDHRCVITRHMDQNHWIQLGRPTDVLSSRTEAAHIIPFCYGAWAQSETLPAHIVNRWEVLYRCFPTIKNLNIKPENINDASNGILLRKSLHDEFGQFNFAFKPVEMDNVYEITLFENFSTAERLFIPENRRVELKKADGAQEIALPLAALLDCHYRLAQILNASRMGEAIDHYIRDWENIKGSCDQLAEDGTTNVKQLLEAGLWQVVQC